jgi:hypothetical protein
VARIGWIASGHFTTQQFRVRAHLRAASAMDRSWFDQSTIISNTRSKRPNPKERSCTHLSFSIARTMGTSEDHNPLRYVIGTVDDKNTSSSGRAGLQD